MDRWDGYLDRVQVSERDEPARARACVGFQIDCDKATQQVRKKKEQGCSKKQYGAKNNQNIINMRKNSRISKWCYCIATGA